MQGIPFRSNAVVVHVLRRRASGVEVLLLKRNKGDGLDSHWLHVAGKIEAGESAWQAALRELREETGLNPAAFYSANYCEHFYSVRGDCIDVLPLFAAFVDENAVVTLNGEHSEYQWFPFAAAKEAVPFNNQRECLRVIEETFILREPPAFLEVKAA